MKEQTYEAEPIAEEPLLDRIDSATMIAWFRCCSCLSCKWREQVIDNHPSWTIRTCARWHQHENIVEMVRVLGYSKE